MELKGIKNIIFDLGGVLLNIDFNLAQQAFVKLGVANFEVYHSKAKQEGLFSLFETGKLSEAEFCQQLRNLTNINATDNQLIDSWNAMLLDFPIVRKKLLLKLKQQYSTVLLSNTNETHVRAFHQIIQKDIGELSLDNLFHSHYFSNEIGYRKPNKEAFEFVLVQNNFNPSETLFIDDVLEHVNAAKRLGIQVHYLDLEKGETIENLFNEN